MSVARIRHRLPLAAALVGGAGAVGAAPAAAAVSATVTTNPGFTLSVRAKPTSASKKVGRVADGQRVTIVCQARGQRVTGKLGTSRLWDRLSTGGFVSDTYVKTGSDGRVAPNCGSTPSTPTTPTTPTTPAPSGFPKDVTSAPDVARYDDAGPYNGGKGCTKGFTPGAKRLQGWLRANFGPATIQGFSCRPNTASPSKTSIHGVGRASDWFKNASKASDRAIVSRFIARMTANGAAQARAMGVQYFIWNRKQYSVRGKGILVRSYSGPNPHTDHVHIEQNIAGSKLQTSYWKLAAR
jgi:uncharacterized protein YraI